VIVFHIGHEIVQKKKVYSILVVGGRQPKIAFELYTKDDNFQYAIIKREQTTMDVVDVFTVLVS